MKINQNEITLQQMLLTLLNAEKEIKNALSEQFHRLDLEKGQLLISPHLQHLSLHFLQSGILRIYTRLNTEDITLQLYLPGSFIIQQGAYIKSPAQEYTEALTRCTLQSIDFNSLETFLVQCPQAIRLLLGILELRQLSASEHHKILHLSSATTRYQYASDLLGIQLQQLPRDIVASYLNISRKHLGRICSQEARKSSRTKT